MRESSAISWAATCAAARAIARSATPPWAPWPSATRPGPERMPSLPASASRFRAIEAIDYSACGERFFRPTGLAALFALMKEHPAARLVAGATEIGVEINKKFSSFPRLISLEGIPELDAHPKKADEWLIGGAATFTTIEEAMAGEYPSLARMLGVFASRGIRNRATMGGNLATASPIGDSAPVLLSLDASLVLASAEGERRLPISEFFLGYRKTALRPGEIILGIAVPLLPQEAGLTRRMDFLKVSKRRELDISIVAGAFRLELDAAGIVRLARLAYGGVALKSSRALEAEEALLGRRLEESESAVAEALGGEFQADRRRSRRRRLSPRSHRESLGKIRARGAQHRARRRLGLRARPGISRGGRLALAGARERASLEHESAPRATSPGGALYVDDAAQAQADAGDVAGLLALRPRANHVAQRGQGRARRRE